MAADDPKNRPYLSTVGGPENRADLSIVAALKNRADLSIVDGPENRADLSIDKIDARRKKLRLSIARLLNEACVHRQTWADAKARPDRVRKATLERLDRALDRLDNGERAPIQPAAIAKLYLFAACMVAARCGADVAAIRAMALDFGNEKPNEEAWLFGARVRRVAMYLVACEWELGKAALANAIGCSRQNLFQAVKSIEELREAEPALDALIVQLAACGKVA